jgi:hypothetical protein
MQTLRPLRLCRTAKWTGLIVCAALAALCVASYFRNYFAVYSELGGQCRYWFVAAFAGTVSIHKEWGVVAEPSSAATVAWSVFSKAANHADSRALGWPKLTSRTWCWTWEVPLLPPILVLALPIAWLWWHDRSMTTRGSCRKCGYSLLGLPPNSPCPECGHSAPMSPVLPPE